MRDHTGDLSLNTVSGELAASGALTRVQANSVSGELALDVTSGSTSIEATTVSGDVTVRLPEGERVNVTANAVSGRLVVDGEDHSGNMPGRKVVLRTTDATSTRLGEHRLGQRHPAARRRRPRHGRRAGRA